MDALPGGGPRWATPPLPPIVVVEDDDAIRSAIRALLDSEWIANVGAPRLAIARRYVAEINVSGLVLDYDLPDGNAGELLDDLVNLVFPPPTVMISAHPDAITMAKHFGVAFIPKPLDLDVLLAAVRILQEGRGRPVAARRDTPTIRIKR